MKIDDEARKTQIWKDRVNDREGDIEEERKEKKLKWITRERQKGKKDRKRKSFRNREM